MDLTSPKTIRTLLCEHDSKPKRSLGQNFLIDRNAIRKLLEAAELQQTDTVLEIGPGIGTLTIELAQKVKRVVAVEKDAAMVRILRETLKDHKNIEVIHEDSLQTDYPTHQRDATYKVVANLPFYITAPVLRKFLEEKNKPTLMALMVQKEVAQRICSKPPSMNLLAVSVQLYAAPKIASYVRKTCFWPQPKVDSAILRVIPNSTPNSVDPILFFRVVKAGFSQPRKQLANNFSAILGINKKRAEEWLLQSGIIPSKRAEALSMEDWTLLTNHSESIQL